jgi:hypothetical protein
LCDGPFFPRVVRCWPKGAKGSEHIVIFIIILYGLTLGSFGHASPRAMGVPPMFRPPPLIPLVNNVIKVNKVHHHLPTPQPPP